MDEGPQSPQCGSPMQGQEQQQQQEAVQGSDPLHFLSHPSPPLHSAPLAANNLTQLAMMPASTAVCTMNGMCAVSANAHPAQTPGEQLGIPIGMVNPTGAPNVQHPPAAGVMVNPTLAATAMVNPGQMAVAPPAAVAGGPPGMGHYATAWPGSVAAATAMMGHYPGYGFCMPQPVPPVPPVVIVVCNDAQQQQQLGQQQQQPQQGFMHGIANGEREWQLGGGSRRSSMDTCGTEGEQEG
jgi:hypothetical protein